MKCQESELTHVGEEKQGSGTSKVGGVGEISLHYYEDPKLKFWVNLFFRSIWY